MGKAPVGADASVTVAGCKQLTLTQPCSVCSTKCDSHPEIREPCQSHIHSLTHETKRCYACILGNDTREYYSIKTLALSSGELDSLICHYHALLSPIFGRLVGGSSPVEELAGRFAFGSERLQFVLA